MNMPKLEFNSIGLNLPQAKNRNCNIFEIMLNKKKIGDCELISGNPNNIGQLT